jgi:uncharacterized protein YceK
MKKTVIIGSIILTIALAGCSSASTTNETTSNAQNSTATTSKAKTNQKATKGKRVSLANNPNLLHLLKLDPLTVKDEMKSGKSLVNIGKEQNVTEDQMVNTLEQIRDVALQKKGKTQDQINQSNAKWEVQIKKQLERVPKSTPAQ